MSREWVVGDRWRTNPLSLTPGGESVWVTYTDGTRKEYTSIKSPRAYFRRIDLTGVTRVETANTILYEVKQKP